ncbi:MAG: ABC transporter ATP-binding protein [Bifidobacteriaceae bacterium]|nr:ABC transporter ATP-binding protein [Bifidobacteriaceae bacterium]
MNPRRSLIELDRIERVYPGSPPVAALRPASLSISSGDYVAVVGPSGSGKSTLLNVLGLLDMPTGGRYWLDGFDTGSLAPRGRAALRGSRIGFVFQAFHLMDHRSVLENVALTGTYSHLSRSRRHAAAREAIDRVGLTHRVDFLPSHLSGGERQRVAIARALAGSPKVLLCDEPTGNLDSHRAAEIIDLFEAMHADGLAVVVVTHDEDVAARASRRLHVRDGQVTVSDDVRRPPDDGVPTWPLPPEVVGS